MVAPVAVVVAVVGRGGRAVLAVEAEVAVAGEGHVPLAVERELAPDVIRSYVRLR